MWVKCLSSLDTLVLILALIFVPAVSGFSSQVGCFGGENWVILGYIIAWYLKQYNIKFLSDLRSFQRIRIIAHKTKALILSYSSIQCSTSNWPHSLFTNSASYVVSASICCVWCYASITLERMPLRLLFKNQVQWQLKWQSSSLVYYVSIFSYDGRDSYQETPTMAVWYAPLVQPQQVFA